MAARMNHLTVYKIHRMANRRPDSLDSMHSTWILGCLKLYKINRTLQAFIRNSMRMWCTTLEVNFKSIAKVAIKCRIYQGDALSSRKEQEEEHSWKGKDRLQGREGREDNFLNRYVDIDRYFFITS